MQSSDQNDFKHHRQNAMVLKILKFISIALLLTAASLVFNLLYRNFQNNKIFSRLSASNSGLNYTLEKSGQVRPVKLEIPAINLIAPIVGVSTDSQNSLEIPSQDNEVGWYSSGTLPGKEGSAVIDGHLDTVSGPAIFWHLGKLKPNDQIILTFSDGSQKHFTVFNEQNFPQNSFPSEQVYGNPGFAALNLVTCSGIYSHSIGRYSDDLVVFSKLNQ